MKDLNHVINCVDRLLEEEDFLRKQVDRDYIIQKICRKYEHNDPTWHNLWRDVINELVDL
jgi:hypothetical protein